MAADPPDACPLCGTAEADPVSRTPYEAIWEGLATQWSASFSADVRQQHTPRPTADLLRCRRCRLDYFSPLNPGHRSFYEEFDRAGDYHVTDRWEFGVVAAHLEPGLAILDVGCGRGAFLQRVAATADRVVGLDHNRAAVDSLRGAGIEARDDDLAALAEQEPCSFDLVTSFHTLEHLPDVDQFFRPALACLRPGGRLVVSVPHRDRFKLEDFEVLDFPPHHVSRWSADQLRLAGSRYGLEVERLVNEPLALTSTVHIGLRRSARRLATTGRRSDRTVVDEHETPLWRRSRWGLAVMAWFRSPTE